MLYLHPGDRTGFDRLCWQSPRSRQHALHAHHVLLPVGSNSDCRGEIKHSNRRHLTTWTQICSDSIDVPCIRRIVMPRQKVPSYESTAWFGGLEMLRLSHSSGTLTRGPQQSSMALERTLSDVFQHIGVFISRSIDCLSLKEYAPSIVSPY